MSCKFLKLTNCEITGATYQGRKINFLNKDITADTFVAKVFDKDGFSVSEIEGIKSGRIVYFPFTSLQAVNKSQFNIKYWANFVDIGNVQFAEEVLTISDNCSTCKPQDPITPYTLNIGSNVVNFHLEESYIQVGQGEKGEQGIQGEKGEIGIQGIQGEKGEKGETGNTGFSGWSPLLVADTTTIAGKTLMKLDSWIGGTGTAPTLNVGKWQKADGIYTDIASDALDFKGEIIAQNISIKVDDNMHLILQTSESSEIDLHINNNGHLILA